MDIVSAASLTNPASTNHTPGSRADPGSEICRFKAQQCWVPSHHLVSDVVHSSRGSSGSSHVTAAGLLRHPGDPKAGGSSCLLAPAPSSAAARTCATVSSLLAPWNACQCQCQALLHASCYVLTRVPQTWCGCLPMRQAGKPLGLLNAAGTWQTLRQTVCTSPCLLISRSCGCCAIEIRSMVLKWWHRQAKPLRCWAIRRASDRTLQVSNYLQSCRTAAVLVEHDILY